MMAIRRFDLWVVANYSLLLGQSLMDRIRLENASGATAEIAIYGAHLLQWAPANGRDWIFLSKKALFEQGKAIRGGVPVIFPQFNEFGPGMRHGFARISQWEQLATETQGNQRATFRLVSTSDTRNLWPFDFVALYHVVLDDDQLTMTLSIENTDRNPIEFTAALHTYLRVKDFPAVKMQGLNKKYYWDNGSGPLNKRSLYGQDALCFEDAIDRIYFGIDGPLVVQDGADTLEVSMKGFQDVVVWNPGAAGAQSLRDMDDLEFLQMLCVEAAVIDQPVRLAPGEIWYGSQILHA